MKNVLSQQGIQFVFHYSPLHYLSYILRDGTLLSKVSLKERGFLRTHFRRTSHRQDEERGFGGYVHLTTKKLPPIVRAKLCAGFPHFEIRIPAHAFDSVEFHLCRFNIAKCRYLKRPGGTPLLESAANGRYRGLCQIPISVTASDSAALLASNHPHTMVEVLIPQSFSLGPDTELAFFSEEERMLGQHLTRDAGRCWRCLHDESTQYRVNTRHEQAVREFLRRVEQNPQWTGNGLNYDSV